MDTYMETLEKQEVLADKLSAIKSIEVNTVTCVQVIICIIVHHCLIVSQCKYTAETAATLCIERGHEIKKQKSIKRFFKVCEFVLFSLF